MAPRVINPGIGPSRVKLWKRELRMSGIFSMKTRLKNKNPPESCILSQFANLQICNMLIMLDDIHYAWVPCGKTRY